jgi:16S rRNA (guanine966-N2)-methyltransferase
VRPTSERVREALFSILGPSVADSRVLDAFAGSGALGIEALSRGARAVEFIESAPEALAVLRGNVEALGLGDRVRIVRADAVSALTRRLVGPPFDLILADPPYGSPVATRFLSAIASGPWLSAGGQLVIERGKADPPGEGTTGLTLTNSRRYGDTRLDFYAP